MIKKIFKKSLTVQIFYDLQNDPIFHCKERLVNLARGRESSLLVNLYYKIISLPFGEFSVLPPQSLQLLLPQPQLVLYI